MGVALSLAKNCQLGNDSESSSLRLCVLCVKIVTTSVNAEDAETQRSQRRTTEIYNSFGAENSFFRMFEA